VNALVQAKAAARPTFINVRTIIGVDSYSAGDAKAHSAAFGPADVANMKRLNGLDLDMHFYVPDEVYGFFREANSRGRAYEQA